MEALLDDSEMSDVVLDELIVQFKRFLKKENDELFEDSQLKYMTYLADFKAHIEEMPDFKNKSAIQTNLSLLKIYELPKKRNNLLSAFLVYFYLQNNSKMKGKMIFKVIHLYMLIITYRNRLPERMRNNMLSLDVKRFRSIGDRISSWWHGYKRKHVLLFSRQTKTLVTL